jgi:hypothetical protein
LAILVYLPGADDTAVRTPPSVGHNEIRVSDVTQRWISDLTVVIPFILSFNDRILEDQRSEAEIDAVLLDFVAACLRPIQSGP